MKLILISENFWKQFKVLKFFKFNKLVPDPKKGTKRSAGYDISSIEDKIIPSGERKAVQTGLRVKMPLGCYGRLASRSSLALYYSIDVVGGVIDPDFTGQIIAILANNSKVEYKVKPGDRIAQLIIEKYFDETPLIDEKKAIEEQPIRLDLVRGEKGFGSTGI